MIRVNQVKVPYGHPEEQLIEEVAKVLRIPTEQILFSRIFKASLDARKKPDIYMIYTMDVKVVHEERTLRRCKNKNVSQAVKQSYQFPEAGREVLKNRPVIIGSGPAGLFCAYELAIHGYRPLLLERGGSVEERLVSVERFWETNVLDPECNVQFGEGGAGTFSDGKLNTSIKDRNGRIQAILKILAEHGAPEHILYQNKPHIGTDILAEVVKNIRTTIENCGGEVLFHKKMTDVFMEDGHITGVKLSEEKIETDVLVLAIGHSARDTVQMLYDRHIPMEAKAFAVGVRVEHKQSMIDQNQYGIDENERYPAADYKLAMQTKDDHGVYSFCMCPGGYVVNASSETERLCVNGMSYHDRAGENANSAIVVTMTPAEYGNGHPLSGIAFQQKLEAAAYAAGGGCIPVQRFEDFRANRPTTAIGEIAPQTKGSFSPANVRSILPADISTCIEEGILAFDRKIPGFGAADTLLSGIESRTSSPVRITRNDNFQSEAAGLYPCGEGAGYAGGITSAAADGIKTAEMIAKTYRPFDEIRGPLRKN